MSKYEDLPLKDFKPKSTLVHPEHTPQRAKYPVIDAHNHLLGDIDPKKMAEEMDKAGVKLFINVTGNTKFTFVVEGYSGSPRKIDYFLEHYVCRYPNRFACFTMSSFSQINNEKLIRDNRFTERAVKNLEEDIKKGACGLKITKELGLFFKDQENNLIKIDDKRLAPIWERAGELGVPVLIHSSDPAAFFLPTNRYNEHYLTLARAPVWSFYRAPFSKKELLDQRDRMISRHPNTPFICPHVANYPENLQYVSHLLDSHPNAHVDFSARIDELGRQPYSSREFMIKYQDRILFGTDMPALADVYRTYFRFLETADEYFYYPDYFGRFGYSRWGIYGIHLPDKVLKKIYYKNALKIIPGLKAHFPAAAHF